jgi:hypothetical protein
MIKTMPDQFFNMHPASYILPLLCPYFAYSTYLLSRTTVTLIWPG